MIDVFYDELTNDPIGVVNHIYSVAGVERSDGAEAAMRGHLDRRPQHHFGVHQYRPEDFGLTSTSINGALSDYRQHFGLS